MLRKILLCPKNFFRPVKWYTDQKFFGVGGGGEGGRSSEKIISGKNFFAVRPPHFLGWIDALVVDRDNLILLTLNKISGHSAYRKAEKLTNDNMVAMSSQRSVPKNDKICFKI